MYIPPHVFHHYNNAIISFSPAASPLPSTSSLQFLSQLGCASYNSHNEDEFEDNESANQQETEESNFLVGFQDISNSLREQQQEPQSNNKNRFLIVVQRIINKLK